MSRKAETKAFKVQQSVMRRELTVGTQRDVSPRHSA